MHRLTLLIFCMTLLTVAVAGAADDTLKPKTTAIGAFVHARAIHGRAL
jgi:hypothetical protein